MGPSKEKWIDMYEDLVCQGIADGLSEVEAFEYADQHIEGDYYDYVADYGDAKYEEWKERDFG